MSAEEMQYYVTMDAEDLQEILDQSGIPVTAEAFQSVFNGYPSDVETFGEYVSTDSYELKGDDEEATHTTKLTFTGHPASLMLVFDEDGVVISATLDPVLSTGEILEKAGLNTVIGMGTVFVVLIFISCIIALLPKLTDLITGTGKKKAEPVKEAPKAAAPAPVVEEELVDDLELVAVISAAIAAYTGTSSDGFVVRSIKRSDRNKWKKA
jgi:sodium pump decarboxylase gamma subunit